MDLVLSNLVCISSSYVITDIYIHRIRKDIDKSISDKIVTRENSSFEIDSKFDILLPALVSDLLNPTYLAIGYSPIGMLGKDILYEQW